ncbi:hypothetical protein KBA63_02830 [Candidatus Woesebacteria bacterium]|jgi:hypothetical protein|nr:hypothetical protein [Candidatus Woesebacteria bacterium]MBP9687703.1 hypothetical protein [Candidatus Woesebacteria bacterium]
MGNKPVFDIYKTEIPFAQDWSMRSYGAGNWIFTHPNNLGSILFNLENQVVMVLSTRSEPRADKIREGIAFHLKYGDPDQSILERFLEAESSALSNNKTPDTHFQHFSLLFDYMNNSDNLWYAILECAATHKWVALNKADYDLLQKAETVLSKGQKTKLETMWARNIITMLTLNGLCDYRILKTAEDDDWKEVIVKSEQERQDFAMGHAAGVAIMNTQCTACTFTGKYYYFDNDLGDRARKLAAMWTDHKSQHPECSSKTIGISLS